MSDFEPLDENTAKIWAKTFDRDQWRAGHRGLRRLAPRLPQTERGQQIFVASSMAIAGALLGGFAGIGVELVSQNKVTGSLFPGMTVIGAGGGLFTYLVKSIEENFARKRNN